MPEVYLSEKCWHEVLKVLSCQRPVRLRLLNLLEQGGSKEWALPSHKLHLVLVCQVCAGLDFF